jgi:glycosyltransferase involved in cell wall biosynthesis
LSLSDEFCIGCVGNLFPIKDHMTLLQAVAGFAKVRNRWRLLVIGEGPELATLQGFVDAHPEWKANVSFLGTSHRVAELLNAMDVYVLPSVSEGISNSLLEAMATGLPVLASETGGNPEVVIQGESGLLFPVGDARQLTEQLLLLEAQREWRLQLGQKALRRVRHEFSMDAMIRNYEQLYQGLLGTATSPSRATAEV